MTGLSFKISEEQEKQLREGLSEEGFEIFWESVYINDEETAKRHSLYHFGIKAHKPVGILREGSFIVDDGDCQYK